MEEYLSQNGWHFNKKMCQWAVERMRKDDKPITPLSKEEVEGMLQKNSIMLKNNVGYDHVYVANMCKADFFGSSITDETRFARYIKDVIDDSDGYDGMVFTRFYADLIGSGTPVMWEDMI